MIIGQSQRLREYLGNVKKWILAWCQVDPWVLAPCELPLNSLLTRIAQSEHNVSPFAIVEGVAN